MLVVTVHPDVLKHIGLCAPSQRHLGALVTNGGEKCGLTTYGFDA